MTAYFTRWQGSTDPADMTGLATYAAGGHTITVPLQSLADAQALADMMQAAAQQARRAQAEFLRGALNRALDDAT